MNDGNSKPRVVLPSQVSLEVSYGASHAAFPQAVQLQAPGQLKMHVVGGLTKLEWMAGIVASHAEDASPEFRAQRAVQMAKAILAECAEQSSLPGALE